MTGLENEPQVTALAESISEEPHFPHLKMGLPGSPAGHTGPCTIQTHTHTPPFPLPACVPNWLASEAGPCQCQ